LFHGLDDVIGGRSRHHDGHVPCHVVVADEDVDLAVLLVPPDGSICTSAHPKGQSWPCGVLDILELGEIGCRGADVQFPRIPAMELDSYIAVRFDLGRYIYHGFMLSADCELR
jgi:hypothetical protein